MKRVYLIVLFFIVTLIPFNIKAYDIENYYIDAELKINGDLEVKEYYEMNGNYNGSFNEVYFANPNAYDFDKNISILGYSNIYDGSKINLHEIRGIPKDSDFDFSKIEGTVFEKNDHAEKGDYGYYTVDLEEYGDKYTIYLPSNKNEAFYLNYTIENFAVLHNDIGELWWKRFDRANNTESIGYLRIKIKFPNNSKEFRVWIHGPLNGTVKKVSNNVLLAEITDFNAYTDISVRSTFDRKVISESIKKSDINALDKILAYEQDKANEANYEREQKNSIIKKEFLTKLSSCKESSNRYCYQNLLTIANTLDNVDPEFKMTYLEELEQIHKEVNTQEENKAYQAVELFGKTLKYENYESAKYAIDILENYELKRELYYELGVYLNGLKKIERVRDTVSMTIVAALGIIGLMIYAKAKYDYECEGIEVKQKYSKEIPKLSPSSISYLMKGKITSASISAEILDMIDNKLITYEKKGNDYYLINYEKRNKLNFKQTALINLIFDRKDKINLNDLQIPEDPITKKAKYNHWITYELRALQEGKNEDLINGKYKKRKVNSILIGILLFSIGEIVYINSINYYSITTSLVAGIVILMMIIILMLHDSILVRTIKGKKEYFKVIAFKNFLKDFERLDKKDLPKVDLWRKYLVYATVLGCSKKLLKVMNLKIQELKLEEDPIEMVPIKYINRLTNNCMISSHYKNTSNSDFGS